MSIINLSFEEYLKLEPFTINNRNKNTEGSFYHYNDELLKNFLKSKIRRDSFIDDKLSNLLTIKKYKEKLKKIEELLLPTSLIFVKNKFIGYTMPLLKNSKSYNQILQNPKIDFKTKIELLKRIGQIIDRLKKVGDIHIGDLHESNILLTNNNLTKIIDIDSICLENKIYFPSKYIIESLILEDYSEKYKIIKNNNKITKVHYDENTDLYCYIIIILNTLANFRMHKLLESEFFDYIDYLETIGLPYDFLDCISKIYSTSDNINPYPYLETLPLDKLNEANHLVYTKKTGKPIIYLK